MVSDECIGAVSEALPCLVCPTERHQGDNIRQPRRSAALVPVVAAYRIWFNHFRDSLLAFGFVQSQVDPCLFIYTKDSCVIYGLLWVDDLVLLSNDSSAHGCLVEFLRVSRKYTLTYKGVWLIGFLVFLSCVITAS